MIDEKLLVARELLAPALSDEYNNRFLRLKQRMALIHPCRMDGAIHAELKAIMPDNLDAASLDTLRYASFLSFLKDLLLQDWNVEIEDDKLYVYLLNDSMSAKDTIRHRLQAERCAQFRSSSVQSFIRSMEQPKLYRGQSISIQALIADPKDLMNKINAYKRQTLDGSIVQPYVQLVTNERDEFTGYRLCDIWRYFRYTWSTPYKTMPGRNMYYLVRDGALPFNPVIGIFALGNSVLNLTVRDDDIGWTVDSIRRCLFRKQVTTTCTQAVKETAGSVNAANIQYLETELEWQQRIHKYAEELIPQLMDNINSAISELYTRDLPYHKNTKYPKQETIDQLLSMAEELRAQQLNTPKSTGRITWEHEACTVLYKKKRCQELANLLSAKMRIQKTDGADSLERLERLLANDSGRTAIYAALIANRKNKIGSNMMEIIVCGAIPPYNVLLGGKLVSILACSPRVVRDYRDKYCYQVSEISSRMSGKKIIRDSSLAYLGTTSLYSVGSSQYNRIKVKNAAGDCMLEYKKLGITGGYGSFYFSNETTSLFSQMLQIIDGGKRINNIFGEGTSPRFRMLSRGFSSLGLSSSAFLKHYSPRIVYGMELARNSRQFLLGTEKKLEYAYDLNSQEDVERVTQEYIDFWYGRFLLSRLKSIDTDERLGAVNREHCLVSNQY